MSELDFEYRRLLVQNDALKKANKYLSTDNACLVKELDFVRDWYGTRFERLKQLFKNTEHYTEVCCILANGTASVMEQPNWSLVSERDYYKEKVQKLEKELETVK